MGGGAGVAARPNRLCVIVPTIGRPTLERTLASLRPQLLHSDLAIVVCDEVGERAEWAESVSHGFHFVQVGSRTPWGSVACNTVLNELPADVTHTWRLDDDDVAAPGALEVMRGVACEKPVFLRFQYLNDGVIWIEPGLEEGNIGSPCILAPRSLARWGLRYEGDFDYARDLVEELGEPLWVNQIVAVVHLTR